MKKKTRVDGTRSIYGNRGDAVRLGAKLLSDGRESLYLEYYCGYDGEKARRKRESLKIYLWVAPRTQAERDTNRDNLQLAEQIRQNKIKDITIARAEEDGLDIAKYVDKRKQRANFLKVFEKYLEDYNKKDERMIKLALNRFKSFLEDTPKYGGYKERILPGELTKFMIKDFTEYLQSKSKGEGALTIYKRFKKVVKYAVEKGYLKSNPCDGISIKVDDQILRKDILSIDEMQTLINTKYKEQNEEVRRAFIFSLYCGLRFCDVNELEFDNVDYSNKLLKFEQNKTKGHSSASGVVIPLNDSLLLLIGKKDKGAKDNFIFHLPSHNACLKALRSWTKKAGIDKHITWHCARHSFAVNILNNGANIKTVASLLGHSGLKHTEKYTRAIDSLKEQAINSLPELNL